MSLINKWLVGAFFLGKFEENPLVYTCPTPEATTISHHYPLQRLYLQNRQKNRTNCGQISEEGVRNKCRHFRTVGHTMSRGARHPLPRRRYAVQTTKHGIIKLNSHDSFFFYLCFILSSASGLSAMLSGVKSHLIISLNFSRFPEQTGDIYTKLAAKTEKEGQ